MPQIAAEAAEQLYMRWNEHGLAALTDSGAVRTGVLRERHVGRDLVARRNGRRWADERQQRAQFHD